MPRLVNLIQDLRKEEGKPDTLPIEPFPMKSTGNLDFNRNNFKGEKRFKIILITIKLNTLW